MINSTTFLLELHTKLLSQKVTTEYAISCKDYPHEMSYIDVIFDAYNKADALFNPDNKNSISTVTLSAYLNNFDKTIEIFLKDSTPIESMLILFKAVLKIQKLINSGNDAIKEKFSSELSNNRDYYALFDIDYYLESARTKGIEFCLKELEDDVNIRANTYFNAAYTAYSELLPGFIEFTSSLDPNQYNAIIS